MVDFRIYSKEIRKSKFSENFWVMGFLGHKVWIQPKCVGEKITWGTHIRHLGTCLKSFEIAWIHHIQHNRQWYRKSKEFDSNMSFDQIFRCMSMFRSNWKYFLDFDKTELTVNQFFDQALFSVNQFFDESNFWWLFFSTNRLFDLAMWTMNHYLGNRIFGDTTVSKCRKFRWITCRGMDYHW